MSTKRARIKQRFDGAIDFYFFEGHHALGVPGEHDLHGQTITINSLVTVPSNSTISNGSVVFSGLGDAFSVTGDNVTFKNIRFSGATAVASSIIGVGPHKNIRIMDCTFNGVALTLFNAITLRGDSADAAAVCENVLISGCSFEFTNTHITLDSHAKMNKNVKIINNTVDNPEGPFVLIEGTELVALNWTVSGNIFNGGAVTDGVYVVDPYFLKGQAIDECVINSNIISNCTHVAIELAEVRGNTIISNNLLTDCGRSDGTDAENWIHLKGIHEGCTVTGNRFTRTLATSGTIAVRNQGASGVESRLLISNNHFRELGSITSELTAVRCNDDTGTHVMNNVSEGVTAFLNAASSKFMKISGNFVRNAALPMLIHYESHCAHITDNVFIGTSGNEDIYMNHDPLVAYISGNTFYRDLYIASTTGAHRPAVVNNFFRGLNSKYDFDMTTTYTPYTGHIDPTYGFGENAVAGVGGQNGWKSVNIVYH